MPYVRNLCLAACTTSIRWCPPLLDRPWIPWKSRDVDFCGVQFIIGHPDAAISRLTVVEFRCLLARRRRAGDITATHETRIGDAFAAAASATLAVHAVEDSDFQAAVILIRDLRRQPLRTLDALHLAVAQRLEVDIIATAAACKELSIDVATFFG